MHCNRIEGPGRPVNHLISVKLPNSLQGKIPSLNQWETKWLMLWELANGKRKTILTPVKAMTDLSNYVAEKKPSECIFIWCSEQTKLISRNIN